MSRTACRLIEPLGDGTYREADTGRARPVLNAPVGAMWFADWILAGSPGDAGPDGRFLVVMTPAGTWCPDRTGEGPAGRTGAAPRVTVAATFVRETFDGTVRATIVDGVLDWHA